jgi:hypothetical protein
MRFLAYWQLSLRPLYGHFMDNKRPEDDAVIKAVP